MYGNSVRFFEGRSFLLGFAPVVTAYLWCEAFRRELQCGIWCQRDQLQSGTTRVSKFSLLLERMRSVTRSITGVEIGAEFEALIHLRK